MPRANMYNEKGLFQRYILCFANIVRTAMKNKSNLTYKKLKQNMKITGSLCFLEFKKRFLPSLNNNETVHIILALLTNKRSPGARHTRLCNKFRNAGTRIFRNVQLGKRNTFIFLVITSWTLFFEIPLLKSQCFPLPFTVFVFKETAKCRPLERLTET